MISIYRTFDGSSCPLPSCTVRRSLAGRCSSSRFIRMKYFRRFLLLFVLTIGTSFVFTSIFDVPAADAAEKKKKKKKKKGAKKKKGDPKAAEGGAAGEEETSA